MPTAQSVMLAIHCKKAETVDLKSPLFAYIRTTYSDREADDAADDLERVQSLRAEVALAQNGSQPGVRETLTKYYRYLSAIETRFPISKEKGHAQVSFAWNDAFRPSRRVVQSNIHYEKACVLFNLASLASQQALQSDRTSAEGLTAACKLYQASRDEDEACGTFQLMREGESGKTDTPRSVDITTECSVLLEKLMLTQAQECVYHKAVIDKKSPIVLARLAKQTGSMYAEVERLFDGPALVNYFDKSWAQHVQLKASIYQVEELIQSSRQYHADDKINWEIAALKEAFARLQNTRRIAKGINSDMIESVNRTQELVQSLLAKAEKENNSIYLMKVPAFSELPVTSGALLVKSAAPSAGSLDAAGEQLFAGLVPENSARALSKYTDQVDELLRQQLDRLAAATDNARIKFREWELPETLQALDVRTSAALPDGLKYELEEVENIGGLNHIKGILSEIGELRKEVDGDLLSAQPCTRRTVVSMTAQESLDADARADGEARTRYGDNWRPQPAATASKPYWDRISQYRSAMQKAGDSDQGVLRRLTEHETSFASLNVEAAAAQMPRLQAPLVVTGPEDPAVVVATLRRNMDALQALANERGGMEEAFKALKNRDNVLAKVMATPPQNHDALFKEELKKYDSLIADVDKNLAAQDSLLAATQAANGTFRALFDVDGWRAACETAATGIRESVRQYRELLDHCSEGLRFYLGMSDVVRKAKQEAADFAYTRQHVPYSLCPCVVVMYGRQVQRDELVQENDRRVAQEDADRLAARMAAAACRRVLSHGAGARRASPTTAAVVLTVVLALGTAVDLNAAAAPTAAAAASAVRRSTAATALSLCSVAAAAAARVTGLRGTAAAAAFGSWELPVRISSVRRVPARRAATTASFRAATAAAALCCTTATPTAAVVPVPAGWLQQRLRRLTYEPVQACEECLGLEDQGAGGSCIRPAPYACAAVPPPKRGQQQQQA
ncbi:programmed cell death protein 6 interacting protein X [Volvox carteri f. nagariensis]|uniref:Programmed cell death protein 6 interacting protein X n=1 Tax=Volvox carteri f. nagariensis TaxID=3068 RepID=D8U9H2_VOLCA|nr:programmed cell death protein 6 interacting protein X [Volvox carteri f. nagariensis]EFJ43641.1 programmed cell death protein 6 interacting protein X [Volvox carteri f. nagariensis]|eukprot:XP_002955341.1 programmed cell death protein 6 interacting protein X [Volvox carteri f. nagariensis]